MDPCHSDEKNKIDIKLMKELTGGNEITKRQLYKDIKFTNQFVFNPQTKKFEDKTL